MLNFRISKSKIVAMNMKKDLDLCLDNELMVVVQGHVYLGTIISKNGESFKDIQDRMKRTNSVENEAIQVCKETELADVRLRSVKLLIDACLDNKIKYGSTLLNILKN